MHFEPLESRWLLTVTVTGVPSWVEQGPSIISGGNNVEMPASDNPQSGAVNAIAADPINADRMYLAATNGGIWSTTNATAASPTWTPLTDQFGSLSIGDIAFSPLDATNQTLFAGAGRFSSGFGDGGPRTGLLKTTDGVNWTQLPGTTLVGKNIGQVIPTSIGTPATQVVLVGTNSGVYRSTDGGVTFGAVAVLAGNVTDLVADTSNSQRFYAAIPGAGNGIFISTNGGQNWTPDNGDISATVISQSNYIELAVHASGANAVFAGIYGTSGGNPTINAFRSTNQGTNWTAMDTPPPTGIPRRVSFVADPTNANVVYMAGTPNDPAGPNPWGANRPSGRIFRGDASQAPGSQWTPMFSNGTSDASSPHPDSRSLVFDANGDLLNANDGGIYKLVNVNTPASRHWVSTLGNLRTVEFYFVAWDNINHTVFGGTQDNGSPQQLVSGAFPAQDRTGADGGVAQVDNTSNPGHSIHYGSEQNLGKFTFARQTFDNTNTPSPKVEIGENIAGTAGLHLNDKDAMGNFTFDTTIQFQTPWRLNAVDPTRMIIGTTFLYESTNQGDTLTALGGLNPGNTLPINPVGVVNPTVHGTPSYNPIAYGGFVGAVGNAEVLWIGAGGKLLQRSSGSGLPTQVVAYPGGTVLGVVMDPTNWHSAFVLDENGKVFMTTNTGASWTDITGNLGVFTTDLRTINAVRGVGGLAIVVGGQGGVYRALNPTPASTWIELGGSLPNAVVHDLQYDATDNVLLVGTFGRGAWTLANASTAVFSTGVLNITGDTDFANEDDVIRIVRNSANPLLIDVFLNGVLSGPYELSTLQQINVSGLGGNDTLIVDSSNGLINVPKGIRFDGGPGQDSVQLLQTGGDTQTTDTYSVGPNNGQGTSTIVGPTGTQTVFFDNLEPVLDLVPAANLIVNATNSNNAINYAEGSLAANGLITIDEQESLEFSNKDNLVINALAGSDTINTNNPSVPTGSTPGGLKTITINGADPTGSDTLVATATSGVTDELFVQPTAQAGGTIVDKMTVHPNIAFTGIEHLTLVGQEGEGDTFGVDGTTGNDAFTYNVGAAPDAGTVTGLLKQGAPGSFPLVPIAFSGMDPQVAREFNTTTIGGQDRLSFAGTSGDDNLAIGQAAGFVVTIGDSIGGQNFGSVTAHHMRAVTVDGLGGNDTFAFDATGAVGSFPPTITLNGGSSGTGGDTLTYHANAAAITGVDLGTSTITSTNAFDLIFSGIETVSIDDNAGSLAVTGTAGDDNISYTPSGGQAGSFQNAGSPTAFRFVNVALTFSILGGAGNSADVVTVRGTNGRDTIRLDASARTALVNSLKSVTLAANIEQLEAHGLNGDDTFIVTPAAGLAGLDNLRITVDGGDPQASDALVVSAAGGGPLAADQFVVVNHGRTPDSGTVRVFTAAAQWPDITFRNVEIVSPNVAAAGNLLLLGPDNFEQNETLPNAAFLGSGSNIQIQHASIFPDSGENPPAPADHDFYRVVAAQTGTLDFQVYFSFFNPALFPGAGALDIQVLDSAGNVIGAAGPGLISVFGAVGVAGNDRVRIPVVAGQSYYLHVFGRPSDGPATNVVNGYDATIINTPTPLPFNLALSRNVPPGTAGAPDTGDLPPNAINSDSGRSQFDNVTNSNLPTIYLRVADGIFLNDLPGNGTTNAPPAGVIPIPFQGPGANPAPGYRVAIFDGNDSQNPIGFATQVPAFPGLYQFTFTTALADGLHHINAAVQMVDPRLATHETGLGTPSLHSLDIVVDTAKPPVFFGLASSPSDGLDPSTDSGVVGDLGSFTDRITNVTTPLFFGTAEANAIIRLFADLDGNLATTNDRILIGQTTAIPIDGTNAFPNGRWTLKSNVDLNDPTFFPHDGKRHILVTAEDLSGNVSDAQKLDIFLDTQGPQVTNVFITDHPNFNLFGLKPDNAPQGPTPLVFSLTIDMQDLPVEDIDFLRRAIEAGIASTPGIITLRGDHNGVIPIANVTATNDPPIVGQAATASIVLTFNSPLPDDRFTLTVLDTLPDPAGNKLDGENNAIEPHDFPLFPTGDGQPGGNFVARFTVDSRPEIGTYAAAKVTVDINGNLLWDPQGQNNDFTNRDLTFALGIVPSLNGLVSPMGVHDTVFVGNFPAFVAREEEAPILRADGFDKLAAYGNDPTANAFRWLIDVNNDGIIDPAAGDHATIQPAGYQINGLPVAGNFDGNSLNGSEIGLFTGTTWYFDTNHNWVIDAGDTVVPTSLRGRQIVGDFNGDGVIDLATWKDDVFYFNFGTQPGGPGTQPVWSGSIDATINWGLPGVSELPVAADMDQDGITDIGLFVPARASSLPISSGNWQFLLSDDFARALRGGKQVSALNHPFSPTPLGTDIAAQFGDAFALPVVGNLDPPTSRVHLPTPTALANVFSPVKLAAQTVSGDKWYSLTPLRSGTIHVDTTSTSGASFTAQLYDSNFRFISGGGAAPSGQTTQLGPVTAGQTYLVRLSGNGVANVQLTDRPSDADGCDTTRDGSVTPADALRVINELLRAGTHATPTNMSDPKIYYDTDMDGLIAPKDALHIINYLLAMPKPAAQSASISAAPLAISAPAVSIAEDTRVVDASAAVAVALSIPVAVPAASSQAVAEIAPRAADAAFAELATAATISSKPLKTEATAPSAPKAKSPDTTLDEKDDLDWLA